MKLEEAIKKLEGEPVLEHSTRFDSISWQEGYNAAIKRLKKYLKQDEEKTKSY